MKRVFIAFALFSVIIISCVTALIHFEKSISELLEHSENMVVAINSDDRAAAEVALSKLDDVWQQKESFFHILSGSQACEQIEQSLEQIKIWFAQKEKSPETLSELYNLIAETENLWESQSPSLINLF